MSEPIEQTLLVERDGPVAILTLNRPKQLNALSVSLRVNIVRTIRDLSAGTDVRAIVLTGSGRAFSAGVDLKEAGQKGFSLGVGDRKSAEPAPDMDLAAAFAACPWPVIGAINGFAITGGFELALMCDVLLASTEAKFADTHSRVGLMPVWGLSQKLPRIIGASRDPFTINGKRSIRTGGGSEGTLTYDPVDASNPDAWQFPPGTRLWKTFGHAGRAVETRYAELLANGREDKMSWTKAAS